MTRRDAEAAEQAHQRLTAALRDVLDDGRAVPCIGRAQLWDSPEEDDIAQAASACALCPVFSACDAAGQFESWGTFAGTWRGKKPVQRKESA